LSFFWQVENPRVYFAAISALRLRTPHFTERVHLQRMQDRGSS
jgi:hypothetical protein